MRVTRTLAFGARTNRQIRSGFEWLGDGRQGTGVRGRGGRVGCGPNRFMRRAPAGGGRRRAEEAAAARRAGSAGRLLIRNDNLACGRRNRRRRPSTISHRQPDP